MSDSRPNDIHDEPRMQGECGQPRRGVSERHRFSSSTALVAGSQIVRYGLTLAVWAVIARLLGPKALGEIQIVYLLPAWVLLFTNLGLPIANIYYLSTKSHRTSSILGHALWRWIIESCITVAFLLAARSLVLKYIPLPPQTYLIVVFWIPLQIFNSYFTSILTAEMRFSAQLLVNLVQGFSVVCLTFIALTLFNSGVTGAIASIVASTALTNCLQFWLLRHDFEKSEIWPRLALVRACLNFGLRGYFANLAQFITYRLDSFIVSSLLGMGALGVYAAAYTASEMLFYLPSCVATVIFPITGQSSREAANQRTASVCRLTFTFALVVGLVGAVTAHWLYPMMLGPKFQDSTRLLWVLLPGTVMLAGTKVMTADMLGRGFPQYASRGSIGAMILITIFDIVFIPHYGVMAAAIISSVAYGLQTVYYVRCFKKVTGIKLGDILLVTERDIRALQELIATYSRPVVVKLRAAF